VIAVGVHVALEYVKHNRPINSHDMSKYGKLADHDINVPCLLLYELGKIRDKNGTEVDIDRDFIKETMERTNTWIKKRHLMPFAKFITQWSKPLDQVNAIPLIKNHKTDEVENQVGNSVGLLYTEEIDGILSLFVKVVIFDIEAKKDVENNLLRAISIGTRPEGSIKEISFVINEAAPLCGLMFSEPSFKKQSEEPIIVEETIVDSKALELAEEIQGLQFAECELENVIIPNHIVLSRMIKTGKVYPFNYDDLIKASPSTLELMERSTPARDLGIMLGTNRDPERIDTSELKFEEMLKQSQDKLGLKPKKKEESPKAFELIRQNKSHDELRAKELKHILELAEHSPDVAAKYIKYELGEEVDTPKYKDTLLTEYLGELKNIKTKLKQLQLGE
jgi:hypothetical protein